MPKVAIKKCKSYEPAGVRASIHEIFELLELGKIIKPNQKVLLKPNLLASLPIDRGATTHPLIVKAIAEEIINMGAQPFIGDSPGGIGIFYDDVIKATGISDLGIPILNFDDKGARKFSNPGGKIDPIYISNVVLDFDIIINIPKLKTHELTQISCGIKNMFGCVPGLHKVNYHLAAPKPEEFSEALVDLFRKVIPAFTIVDAVTAMEGQGPTNGKLRDLGLIIASDDAVAADAVISKIIGYEPFEIHTTRIAHQKGLGIGDIANIEIIGEKMPAFRDFKRPGGSLSLLNSMPLPLGIMIKPLVSIIHKRPKINKKKCIRCMVCVGSCPTGAIDKKSFNIAKNKCIMCLCCRELCKYGAVDLKESILWKILRYIRGLLT